MSINAIVGAKRVPFDGRSILRAQVVRRHGPFDPSSIQFQVTDRIEIRRPERSGSEI
jgi:hypothetical protein